MNGETVEFESDSFSVFVVSGYTVDFHWDEVEYNLAGGGTMLLSALLKELRIRDFTIDDVRDVSFSDASLMRVKPVERDAEGENDTDEATERDWMLTALRAFDTRETLTISLRSGETVSIPVTDHRTVNEITQPLLD